MKKPALAMALLLVTSAASVAQTVKKDALDRYGDPLPEGAVARLGTARFRHGFFMTQIAFSPNGKILASGGRDPGLCLWEADTGRRLHRLWGNELIFAVAFSPNGKTLFAEQNLIDVATGKVVRPFKAIVNSSPTSAAFSPDGKAIAAGFRRDSGIVLWNVETGEELHRFKGHAGHVASVAISPSDRTVMASAGSDKTVRLWDTNTGKQLQRLDGHTAAVNCVAFAPDGSTLASAGDDGLIRIWEAKSGKPVHHIKSAHESIAVVAYSFDGKLLASAGGGGVICLWNPKTGKEVRRWETGFHFVSSVAFSPNGKTLASESFGAIRFWNAETGKEIDPVTCHRAGIVSLRFAPDGKTLLSYGKDRRVFEWNLSTTQEKKRLFSGELGRFFEDYWTAADFAPDGTILAQVRVATLKRGSPPVIYMWDTGSGQEIQALSGHEERVRSVRFSPDGKLMASSGTDGIRIWETMTGKQRRHIGGNFEGGGLNFSPDGKSLASAARGGTILIHNVESGREILRWYGGTGYIDNLVYSPDGRFLASRVDLGARVWAADTGEQRLRLDGEFGSRCIVFSSDGRVLAAGGAKAQTQDESDGAVQLWEIRSGQKIRQIKAGQSFVESLAFAPDGRTLASGGADSTILLWDLTGQAGKKLTAHTAAELDRLWRELASDAPTADRALWRLALSAKQSVPFLTERLKPVAPADPKQVANLLTALNSSTLESRQKADGALTKLGESAETSLRKSLEASPSLELRRRVEGILAKREPEVLRQLRAIDTLEQIATPETRDVLAALVKSSPNPRIIDAANAALTRCARRK